MITLGIDPGYERLGMAVIETKARAKKDELLHSTCIITSKNNLFPERLKSLALEVEKVLAKYKPDTLAIEELFFSGNQKTAMKVSEVRGMIIYLALRAGCEITNLTPLQVKMSITGFGRASKTQIITMIKKLITVPSGKRHDDEYDAIAIALTGAAHQRQNFIHNQTKH
ncbi:MAG: crossover junction endodeoxyribonuclease RuvC [Patescibacteria group bacterium]